MGVSNHLDESESYAIYVKFFNQTQQLPNSTTAEPSPLASIRKFEFTPQDEEIWESSVAFAVDYVVVQQNISQVENTTVNGEIVPVNVLVEQNVSRVESITVNGETVQVNYASIWDSNRNGFYYSLIFELWSYDETLNDFQYANQYVGLQLNMTSYL